MGRAETDLYQAVPCAIIRPNIHSRRGFYTVMTAYILARRPTRGRSVSSGRLLRAGLAVLLFLFMLPFAANAYTLVLRSGRHVNVSDKFKVTPTAIIYEDSPGYWVTVWLSNVDIAATERANGEPAGSFARWIKREREASSAARTQAPEASKAGRDAVRKVVTNKDLESARLMREAQEAEYERTRRERGMPSREELRQRSEEHDRWLSEWAQRVQEERREAELEALRLELMNARLQLSESSQSQQGANYVHAYAVPNYYPYFYAPSAYVNTVLPFAHRGRYVRGRFGRHLHGRPWFNQQRIGRPFPRIIKPARGKGGLLRSMPQGVGAPRHSR